MLQRAANEALGQRRRAGKRKKIKVWNYKIKEAEQDKNQAIFYIYKT